MSSRDHRYELIKPMLNAGNIESFNDIFKFIPKTVVANDLGKKVDRFTTLMNRVEKFTLDELFTIARHCFIEESAILKLAHNEYLKKRKKVARSKIETK